MCTTGYTIMWCRMEMRTDEPYATRSLRGLLMLPLLRTLPWLSVATGNIDDSVERGFCGKNQRGRVLTAVTL
jgi:hypothetical protein